MSVIIQTSRDRVVNEVAKLAGNAYDEGHEDGYSDCLENIDETFKEKIGVEYAAEAFKDCQTLEDFQEKLRELNNRVFNFMPTLGLTR